MAADTIYAVHASDHAKQAIFAHYLWLKQQTDSGADRWIEGILAQIDDLSLWPAAYSLAEESKEFDIPTRKVAHHQHVILFQIREDSKTVEVVDVRHGARRTFGENP